MVIPKATAHVDTYSVNHQASDALGWSIMNPFTVSLFVWLNGHVWLAVGNKEKEQFD